MKAIHGGDTYRNQVKMDYSVNVNPLGMPKEAEAALYKAVQSCEKYPDITAEKLKQAVSSMLQVPQDYLLFGNGASELFMAVIHGIRPQKIVIPVPSFYGYEYAAKASAGEVCYYQTKEEADFALDDDFFQVLTEDVDMVFLANPNNPTGNLSDIQYLHKLLTHCRNKGIYVVLDECFIEFCGREYSMLSWTGQYENLILVRAFTKIFAIPGVRLGYLICSSRNLLSSIGRQLPEWNLSVFAQEAGYACTSQESYVKETAAYVKKEREFLTDNLRKMGLHVFDGSANFILLYCEQDLYGKLLDRGILIRNCENYKGLSKGFYRIAVKSREENEVLLQAIASVLQKGK